ncbi:MAG: hypothetical protein IKN72_00550 [Clostridia bacterium]|nr:hypothetical protein [Clostridia bacterium]MBR3551862.1 hypothetical protein [Clostridia bacterium]
MKCPKCGGEIPFYDLKPNCKHCGVNIFYYSQDTLLARDAKRTELEAGAARMVIARIKSNFIGGKLAILRMIAVIASVCVLMVPVGSMTFNLPLLGGGISAGLIGAIQMMTNGTLGRLSDLKNSTLLAQQTQTATTCLILLCVLLVISLVIFAAFLLGFLNLTRSTKFMRVMSVVGMAASAAVQIAAIILVKKTPESPVASDHFGFGGAAAFAVFLVLFLLNHVMLKKGVEPTYREYDPKRKELLKKVRKGEVNLDDLSLPVFESKEEYEARMKALEHTLEEEG